MRVTGCKQRENRVNNVDTRARCVGILQIKDLILHLCSMVDLEQITWKLHHGPNDLTSTISEMSRS